MYFPPPGSLGDGLLALKTVHVLKKQFPDHLVVWFGHKEIGAKLAGWQDVHQAYSFDDIHFLTSGESVHVKEGISLDDALNKGECLLSGKQISVCSGSSGIS
jgi:hypothetical protein